MFISHRQRRMKGRKRIFRARIHPLDKYNDVQLVSMFRVISMETRSVDRNSSEMTSKFCRLSCFGCVLQRFKKNKKKPLKFPSLFLSFLFFISFSFLFIHLFIYLFVFVSVDGWSKGGADIGSKSAMVKSDLNFRVQVWQIPSSARYIPPPPLFPTCLCACVHIFVFFCFSVLVASI